VFLATKNEKLSNKEDVDNIVIEGTKLFQNHIDQYFDGIPRYLLIDELPANLVIDGINYSMKLFPPLAGLLGTHHTDNTSLTFTIVDALSKSFATSGDCFLTIGNSPGYTSGIRKTAENRFLCFDSHSRSLTGTRSVNSTAVLLQITSVNGVAEYITDLAKSLFTDNE